MEHDSGLLMLALQHSERIRGDLRLLQQSLNLKEHFRSRDLLRALLAREDTWNTKLKKWPRTGFFP